MDPLWNKADQLGKEVRQKMDEKKAAEEAQKAAAKEAQEAPKRHEEDKKQGML